MNPHFRRLVLLFLALLTCAPNALADGKMFIMEKVPTTIPYQRAIILHAEGTQTLVLQSQYQIPGAADTKSIGWVVPVPATPQITSVPAEQVDRAFFWIDRATSPRVTRIGKIIWATLFWSAVAAIPVCIVGAFLTLNDARKRWLIGIAVSVLSALAFLLWPATRAWKAAAGGVETLKSQQAGIYDVQVIRAKAAADVLAWLNENTFQFGPEDEAAIQGYLDKGWVFTVAKIHPSAEPQSTAGHSEGLADPLILRFPAPNPIYPLALTATGGHDTEVLIYLASDAPRTNDGRLALRYAGKRLPAHALFDLVGDRDDGFWTDDELSGRYPFTRLAKFKGTLTPDQMRKDLEFLPDPNQTDYREHIYRW